MPTRVGTLSAGRAPHLRCGSANTMKFEELGLGELLKFGDEDGLLRFAGDPVLLLDADVMGDARQHLVAQFGEDSARAVFEQLGFSQGWRLADRVLDQFEWPTDETWGNAGSHLGRISGLFQSPEGLEKALSPEGISLRSPEANQQLRRHGRADRAVCWITTGFVSGYLSRKGEMDALVLEDKCRACGDPSCHFRAQTRSAWAFEAARLESGNEKSSIDHLLEHVNHAPKKATPEPPRPKSERPRSHDVEQDPGLVTQSPKMRETAELAERIADVHSTVLITGESGTGKERIARFIHARSSRARERFVAINCGAIPEELIESELFGHARGSFSGAFRSYEGIFEAAHGGTLLLDEISEISPRMQVKLLRVLQEREVRRVGESQTRPVDVRLLAATNANLVQEVQRGNFREDLYYRIHVVEVFVPPLRERREDILPLARTLLHQSAERLDRKIEGFSPAVAERLMSHDWPGNVRELENTMERGVVMARGSRVELEDMALEALNAVPRTRDKKLDSVRPLQDVSRDYILAALHLNSGNQTHTARQLGIGSATLYRKLKSYGYQASESDDDEGSSPPVALERD